MTRKLRNSVLLLLAAAVLAGILWMFWPRPLAGTLDLEGQEIAASILTFGTEEVPGEEGPAVQPTIETERFLLPAGSAEAQAVLDLLSGYTWHPCWETWTGESGLSGIGPLSVTLYDQTGGQREFSVYSGTGKIRLNGQIVRLEYLGNETAAALSQDLAHLLRTTASPAPTA